MGPEAIDYRVSKIVVLCKDCGQDVGMYPARHKCEEVVRPPLPPLPTSSQLSGLQSRNITRDRSPARSDRPASPPPSPMPSKKPEANRKPKFGRNLSSETTEDEDTSDRQIYFNDIGDDSAASTPSSSGRKLWGNLKQNEKWKQMAYGEKQQNSNGSRLWDKLMQATQSVADKIPNRDDKGPESDDSDWEGETHVSRILREYHEKKGGSLPSWLRDSRTPVKSNSNTQRERYSNEDSHQDSHRLSENTRQRQRLWDAGDEPVAATPRERERQRLREQAEERDSYRRQYSEELDVPSRPRDRSREHPEERESYRRQYDKELDIPSRQRDRSREPSSRHDDRRAHLNRSATTDHYSYDERARRHERERERERSSHHTPEPYESERHRMRSMREVPSTRRETPSSQGHRPPPRREADDYEQRQHRPRARSPMYEDDHSPAGRIDREQLRGPRRAPTRKKLDDDMLVSGYF